MKKLNKEIVQLLSNKLEKTEATIKKDIYSLRGKYSKTTINGVAQIYAVHNQTSILRKLDKEDRESMPNLEIERPNRVLQKHKNANKVKEKIETLINYDSTNYFITEHIKEINLAFTKRCYTSVNILVRKIVENLIIDILRNKFPSSTPGNIDLYYDKAKSRYKDFSIVLKNLYNKRTSFPIDDKKKIERLYEKAKKLKEFANDSAHSLYYIIKNKEEVNNFDLDMIFELIKVIEKSIGMR